MDKERAEHYYFFIVSLVSYSILYTMYKYYYFY